MNLQINYNRDGLLTRQGMETIQDRYMLPGERPQDMYARVAKAYSNGDPALAQRLYDYMSLHWFSPATPILSNGGTNRGLPVSCYLAQTDDTMESIQANLTESFWLSAKGGGLGLHWGNVRSMGEEIGQVGKASGIIPFLKIIDSMTLAISQGNLRRASSAIYLPIDHPDVMEFIEMRKPSGGDPNRKCLNLHHAVVIKDQFMYAVKNGEPWELKSPHTRKVITTVDARQLWIKLLETRMATGEPYLMFMTNANKARTEWHKQANLQIKQSNLCLEIYEPTSESRTAVCCLSSLNLETYDEWKGNAQFYADVFRFLDNVLQDFIDRAPSEMHRAKFSAERERSIGLGVMGWHSFLQQKHLPLESAMAVSWNKKIFKEIREHADIASKALAKERGACPDAADFGFEERFSYKLAIAPTASISIICGGASPCIEPWPANVFTSKTASGTFFTRNKYLERWLEEQNKNTDEVWQSIINAGGSVQHLDFMDENTKLVFKTAFELDQRWLIQHAADRQPFICQGQSLNLFVPSDVDVKTLHALHFSAWEKGLKGLYYLRSNVVTRASTVLTTPAENVNNGEECLACQ